MPEMREIDEVLDEYTGLSRKVLEYSIEMKRMVDAAKLPGYSADSWNELAKFVDTAKFERIGNFKEVMNWSDYVGFLTGWAASSGWEGSFKRVTEKGNLVLLELEERSTVGGHTAVVNSVSVYEFNDDGKIEHLDIYLQMPLPDPSMFQSYEGIAISG